MSYLQKYVFQKKQKTFTTKIEYKTCQCECKNYRECKIECNWNPTKCIYENSMYFMYIIVMHNVSTKKTNTIKTKKTNFIPTNVTSTASINCHSKKVRDCYILHTILLVIILLLIIIIICYHYAKQKVII